MFPFTEFIKQYINLPKDVENAIIDQLKFEELKKGELLIKGKRVCTRLYFLETGTLRSFFYRGTKDITYWIYKEGQMITAWNSFIHEEACTESFEVVEHCKVSSITHEQWYALLDEYPILDKFYRLLLEEQMAAIDEFYKGYFFMTAKEKYDLLISVFPNVTQIANLKHIASMLGISQETLSRIRGVR